MIIDKILIIILLFILIKDNRYGHKGWLSFYVMMLVTQILQVFIGCILNII